MKDKPGVVVEVKRKQILLGTKALKEICKFQKSTEVLIPKVAFYHLVCEVLQKEKLCYKIQASAILALREATEAISYGFLRMPTYALYMLSI